jgi:hypothetical protein
MNSKYINIINNMRNLRSYYYKDLNNLIRHLTSNSRSILYLKEKEGKLIGLKNKKSDYIILKNLIGQLNDLQQSFENIHLINKNNSKLIITYYNHFWEPILKLATKLGWRKEVDEQNWLDNKDIANLLNLTGFEVITRQKRMLIPINIPIVSSLINKWVAPLPVINKLCLITYVVAKPKSNITKKYSVSIVIAARNEEGNIPKIIPQIPKFGKWQEIIFVEGHSKDNTWEAIQKEVKKRKKVYGYKQKGKGKADAVRLGFSKANGEVLMILDADMTVPPADLKKFYNAIAEGKGEFINGSRLVYPMENDAMQTLNKIGNRVFGWLFTWLLGQRFRDTLCGTKVLLKKDYDKIVKGRIYFGDFDPFGDFDLIFGAIKQNMKVVEIPVRYKERVYGTTNISRFVHGWLLLKMTWIAYKKFKAW